MKSITVLIFAFFFMTLGIIQADAASKVPLHDPSGKKDSEKKEKKVKKEEVKKEKEAEEQGESGDKAKSDMPSTPYDFLLKMLAYESTMGIFDYQVEVMEVTRTGELNQSKSVRKVMYYLAPTRQLTLQDSTPVYYIDQLLFQRKMDLVDLERLPDETIGDVSCLVIKMTPREEVFKQNVKHYYLAKDNFRKIRIESTHFNNAGNKRFMVIDFDYRTVNGIYLLPKSSEARMYDERDFLLQTTTSTFMNWRFNTGLKEEFFAEKLKDYKLYDIVK
jgi:hypothetical protein